MLAYMMLGNYQEELFQNGEKSPRLHYMKFEKCLFSKLTPHQSPAYYLLTL